MSQPSGNRLALRVLLALGVLGALAGPGRAQADAPEVARLIAGAAPEVRTALSADAPARAALGRVLSRGTIGAQELGSVLAKPGFASRAGRTLRALEKVDGVEGVRETLGRIAKSGNQGALIGPAFEIEVAAAFAGEVKGVGVMVDGHEVDLLLKDGTRVEVKSFPKNDRIIARKMLSKATEQLALRSGGGQHKVMLVSNIRLDGAQLSKFRGRVGPGSSVMVLSGGQLSSQLGRAPAGVQVSQTGPAARFRGASARSRSAARSNVRAASATHRTNNRATRHKAKARRARR